IEKQISEFSDLKSLMSEINNKANVSVGFFDEKYYDEINRVSIALHKMYEEGKTETLEYMVLIKEWIGLYEEFSKNLNAGNIETTVTSKSKIRDKISNLIINSELGLGYTPRYVYEDHIQVRREVERINSPRPLCF
ncbi:MAG: hypothetical protein Q4A15_09110, partial [Prevotellaceae bacterium]|nr:hypothetical protein [Prevotellaceae bacterium]